MALLAFPAVRSEPAAVDGNPDRLVCGLCASLGEWESRQFRQFLDWQAFGGEPVPLLLDHQPALITPRSAEPANAGTCLGFASVAASGGFPGGLLVLGALHPDSAPSILAGMRRGQWLAMSVRGVEHGFAGEPGDLWPVEVSLVSRVGAQLDPSALVLGYGREAASVWELLTGSPAA
jgi:hypothetical protein